MDSTDQRARSCLRHAFKHTATRDAPPPPNKCRKKRWWGNGDYDHSGFIPGERQTKTQSVALACRHGNSDMCTWLSKASDIQAPLTESHHHHHHHHSTESAAGRCPLWDMSVSWWQCTEWEFVWSHAKSKYNTASLVSRLWTRTPTERRRVPKKAACIKF